MSRATPAPKVKKTAPALKPVKRVARLMKPAAITEMFRRWREANPDPRTELNYTNAFTLLVAVVLSAQMTDKGVNKATEALFAKITTPQQMVKLGLEKLTPYLRTINFYNTKAANVIKLSQALVDQHGGEVPQDRAALEALPGVGRKTANVILNEMFRQPTMAVDTHVYRVANRTGLAPGKTVLDVELSLLKRIPTEFMVSAHHWLILHGRYICVATRPKCDICPIFDLCTFPDKALYALGKPAKLPATKTKKGDS